MFFLISLRGNSLGDCGIQDMVDVEDSRLETLKYVSWLLAMIHS